MALTEEQLKELALRVDAQLCSEGHVATSAAYAIAFAANLIAALPKPEPVAWEWVEPDRGMCISHNEPPEYEVYQVKPLYTEAPIAQPASAPSEQKPVVLPFAIFDQEIADLRRFHECAMDDEGYDVPKDRMKRLAEIGLVRRASGNYYEHTDFGLAVLNGDFDTASKPDYKAQRDALLELLESAIEFGYIPKLPEPCLLTKALTVIAGAKGDKCKTCNGECGWEAAASSTSYFWKDCPDCTAIASVKGGA